MFYQLKNLLLCSLLVLPLSSTADSIKMHISEDNVAGKVELNKDKNKKKAANNAPQIRISEQETNGKTIYLDSSTSKEIDLNNVKDMEALRNSVEFEVYQISDQKISYSVFESAAGICYAFRSADGANMTDSTTYYMDKELADYYLSIVGAKLSAVEAPKDVQYSPVFYIRDPELSEKIQSEEKRIRAYLVKNKLDKNAAILTNVVCK